MENQPPSSPPATGPVPRHRTGQHPPAHQPERPTRAVPVRFIVYPGRVVRSDGDHPRVSFAELCRLSGISPAEAINADDKNRMAGLSQTAFDVLVPIRARSDGNYTRYDQVDE